MLVFFCMVSVSVNYEFNFKRTPFHIFTKHTLNTLTKASLTLTELTLLVNNK